MPPYTLTAQQLDGALAALSKASDTFRLSRFERGVHRALGICAKISVLSVILLIILLVMNVSEDVGAVAGLIFGVSGAATTLLFLASLPLMLKTVRQRRVLKQLGLRDLSTSAWKAQRKRRVFRRFGGALLTIIAVLFLIAVVFWMMGFKSDRPEEVDPWEIVVGVCFFIIGVATLFFRSIQRSREQFEIVTDADRLRATLTSLQAGPEATVEVPAAVLENVARIEHAQIARERAQAVLAGVSSSNRGYSVQLARGALEQKALLPGNVRLEVEELIDALTAAPYPPGAQRDGTLSVRTPDESAEVDYGVDEQSRRIHVLAIRADSTRGSHAL